MRWMYWLPIEVQQMLRKRVEETIGYELDKNRWGAVAPSSLDRIKHFYITDFRALNLATGIIRYTLKGTNTKVFYRGQERDYSLIPSLYRSTKNSADAIEAERKLEEILTYIKPTFDPIGTDDEREALCQHYGLHTRWIDIVDNIQTALWFAYDRSYTKDNREQRFDEDVGYIHVVAFPDDETKVQIIDLREKPSQFLRPHTQQAFAAKTSNPNKELGKLSAYQVVTFIVPRPLLRIWSNYDNIPSGYMYPNNVTDAGLRFWEQTVKKLKKAGLDIKSI
ncbi:FRG domain-containing protein [Pygmaiobacter massiliensis]|uniref:FRG domain-containing protein n=1 Tax=Pygmaiobacter massiliensis TaxID=1917873 RepID=UPI00289B11CF|nr:FRG domain-containing protein [Pygmaiobacter massiliensis]